MDQESIVLYLPRNSGTAHVTHADLVALPKHDDPRISTFCGIFIDRSNESANAYDSSRFNREFDSNDIDESNSHPERDDDPMISIFRPISIRDNDEKLRINR
jgi:hypothetical protein